MEDDPFAAIASRNLKPPVQASPATNLPFNPFDVPSNSPQPPSQENALPFDPFGNSTGTSPNPAPVLFDPFADVSPNQAQNQVRIFERSHEIDGLKGQPSSATNTAKSNQIEDLFNF